MFRLRRLFAIFIAATLIGLTASAERKPARLAPAATSTDPWRSAADLFFKVAARDDGIPDSGLPRAIAQDGEGFIWLGTDAGLARWDGTGFKSYTTEATPGAGALPELMVNLLFADRAGRLWLGMSAEGLLWHDRLTETFRRPANRSRLDHAHILAIDHDGAGGLWVGSDIGLTRIDGTSHRATILTALPVGSVQAVHRDRHGTVWIASGGRLMRSDDGRSFAVVPLSLTGAITALHDDARGRLWVATDRSGFHVIMPDGDVRHLPVMVAGRIPALGQMIETTRGELWTASRFGIWVADPATLRIRRITHDAQLPASLPENGLNALYSDRNGLVWIVGDATLAHVDPAPRRVLGIVSALRAGPGHAPDVAWSLGVAPDGAIWYGSPDAPASRLAPAADGGLAPVQRLPGGRRDLLSFVFAPDSTVFAAGGDGLYQLSLDGRRVRRLSSQPWARMLLQGDRLYMGGGADSGRDNGGGVWVTDWRHPGEPVRAPWSSALSDPRIRSFALTPDGRLWVGTARGLNRVDLASGTVTHLLPRSGKGIGLDANFVATLLCDRQGRLWAGTIGGGITIYSRVAGVWRAIAQLGVHDGLPHATVDRLLLGPDGNIWASTDGGIARIDPTRLTVTPLRASDGVAFAANWTGAGGHLPDGRLVFAGFGGLTIIDPAAPPRAAEAAPLRFTAIRAGGVPIIPAAVRGAPTIPPGDRSLTAEFARLDYADSRDQAYAYRLLPLEQGWTRTDAQHRVARYTNLPPGHSTLIVRALAPTSDGSLRASGAPLVLELDVEERWFETWWFRIAAAIATAGLILALFHLRLHNARQRERQLERLVERRTAELLASQSELEKLAYTDTLTGLGNRRLYGEVLGQHMSHVRRQPFALLLIDLDRFKQVNDDLGHDVGDALLVEVADRLTATIRRRDSIFRLGGDEFAILVPGLEGPPPVAEVCRRLYAGFATPVDAGGYRLQVELSIGAVVVRRHGISTETVYKHADLALYDAKRAGRGTWRMASLDGG